MKRLFQFGSILLAAYLLALPILIGIHAGHHTTHDLADLHKSEHVFQASDCDLCDIYQNQAGVLALPVVQDLAQPFSPTLTFASPTFIKVVSVYTSLRGPPIS